MRGRSLAWGLGVAMMVSGGCKPDVKFGLPKDSPIDPGLRARDLQIEAQLSAACGALGRAHEEAHKEVGQLDGFLNGPAPDKETKLHRKRRGKRTSIARNELSAAEQMWAHAVEMGACPEDLCCVHEDSQTEICSAQIEEPSRAHVERFWIPLPNGLCLQAEGEAVTQRQCEDVPSQRWFVTEVGGGNVNVRNSADRRCLHVSDGAEGTVTMAECGPDPAQRFSPKRTGDGMRELRHSYEVCELAQPRKDAKDAKPPCPLGSRPTESCLPPVCTEELGCIEAEWSDEPGSGLRLGECHGGANQAFAFESTRLLQTRRIDPATAGCSPGDTLRPLGICPRVPSDDDSGHHFFPVPSAARGEIRWACDDGEGVAPCPADTSYAELRHEGAVTVLRCYD